MRQKSYGVARQTIKDDVKDNHVEEIAIRGFTVIKDLFSDDNLATQSIRMVGLFTFPFFLSNLSRSIPHRLTNNFDQT